MKGRSLLRNLALVTTLNGCIKDPVPKFDPDYQDATSDAAMGLVDASENNDAIPPDSGQIDSSLADVTAPDISEEPDAIVPESPKMCCADWVRAECEDVGAGESLLSSENPTCVDIGEATREQCLSGSTQWLDDFCEEDRFVESPYREVWEDICASQDRQQAYCASYFGTRQYANTLAENCQSPDNANKICSEIRGLCLNKCQYLRTPAAREQFTDEQIEQYRHYEGCAETCQEDCGDNCSCQ